MIGYEFHPEAEVDLDVIWDSEDNVDAADRVMEEIEATIEALIPLTKGRDGRLRRILILGIVTLVVVFGGFVTAWMARPSINWTDRRPIGALFLADYSHASPTNPRGWFNRPSLDVVGSGGRERFRKALLEYADQSIAILRRTGAQGMIVWDLEGQEFPQKTSYIGDPRLLDRLAPEMASAVDEFFYRFRTTGLRVGVTVRPQEIVFDAAGQPRQTSVPNYDRILLEKIDYARTHWGATLFYIDSNGGILRPVEAFRLRRLALQRPDVLLIPEHHHLLYYSFSAPYASLPNSSLFQLIYPRSLQVLNIGGAGRSLSELSAARRETNIPLFPAWFCGAECLQLELLHSDGSFK